MRRGRPRAARTAGRRGRAAGAARAVPSAYIETYAKLYTRAALRCYLGMLGGGVLGEATQAVGWGYDRCLGAACRRARSTSCRATASSTWRPRAASGASAGWRTRRAAGCRRGSAAATGARAWPSARAAARRPSARCYAGTARTNERPRTKREGRAARPRPVPT